VINNADAEIKSGIYCCKYSSDQEAIEQQEDGKSRSDQ
jgi:hypothetical protein